MVRTLLAKNEYFTVRDRAIGRSATSSDAFHLAIASTLDCKIFVEARKHRVLSQLENDDLSRRLTTNPNETNLHIVGMGSVTPPVSS